MRAALGWVPYLIEHEQLASGVVGCDPDTVIAPRGRPLRLLFDRREESPCSDEIVFPDFGIRRRLPAHATTEIVITPGRAGEYPFSCGMNMLHGKIVVVDEK